MLFPDLLQEKVVLLFSFDLWYSRRKLSQHINFSQDLFSDYFLKRKNFKWPDVINFSTFTILSQIISGTVYRVDRIYRDTPSARIDRLIPIWKQHSDSRLHMVASREKDSPSHSRLHTAVSRDIKCLSDTYLETAV